ncbi:MAG TPA: ABC transporter permease [bacterium]|nr:ABC transporter permease [bacterium]
MNKEKTIEQWITNPTLRVIYLTVAQILRVALLGLTFEGIGEQLLRFLETTGGIAKLLVETLWGLIRPPYRFRLFMQQAVVVGWQTIPLIAATLGFLGMIVMLELRFQLTRVLHNISLIPGIAGLMFFREFGATVVMAMLAAKVGAGFTAEIGGMKTTDQIDALELMGVSPVHYLVVPRFAACMVMGMALSVIGLFAAFMMGFLSSFTIFNYQTYLGTMNAYVGWPDFINLILKALALGWVVPITSCYYGLTAGGGARGVGEATTKSVVTSILIIIILDFTISAIADKLVSAVLSFT